MPIMDGLEATRQIRAIESSKGGKVKRVPIVAITASAFQEDRDRCIVAGMDGVLTKPLRVHVVTAELRRWLPA